MCYEQVEKSSYNYIISPRDILILFFTFILILLYPIILVINFFCPLKLFFFIYIKSEPQLLEHLDHALCCWTYYLFPCCCAYETETQSFDRKENQFLILMIMSCFFLPSIYDCCAVVWFYCGDGSSMIFLDPNSNSFEMERCCDIETICNICPFGGTKDCEDCDCDCDFNF